jgi:DNA-binding Lrp family transcriptional regulator
VSIRGGLTNCKTDDIFRGFTAVVDPGALGWGTEAFVEVHCRGNVAPFRIRDGLLSLPEVEAAYTVSGAADAIVHLRAGGIPHLESALERLRALEFVDRTVSTVVLSTLVSGIRCYDTVTHSRG